ncbi:MAG: hypothetical protein PHX61_05480 [Alphaproteobacteria bacterium]|nr:hypothetical protein [Alphaproteobacteria bacterium]
MMKFAPVIASERRERSNLALTTSGLRRQAQAFLAMTLIVLFTPSAYAATVIPFTINMSEAVNVTGTPRVAVDVGGVTRYADYTSGTGTSTLTFTYAMVAGDVDLDGVALSSPIDLNGGTIVDLNGNALSDLTFTPPDTSAVKVNYPSLGMDFVYDADGRYTLNGTVYNDLPSFLGATGGTFTRASVGTYYDSSGVLQTATSGTPRFDHDPVTLAPKGVLIEESSTNQMGNSELVGSWVQANVNVASNTVQAPDGTMTADTVTTTGGNGLVRQTIITAITAGQTITRTLFAKAGTTSTVIFEHFDSGYGATKFNVSTCTLISAPGDVTTSTQQLPNNWCRIQATRTFTAGNWDTVYIDTYGAAAAGMSIHLWGGQMEVKSFPTSYIPTTSAAVTRAADVFTVPTGGWFNTSATSIYASFNSNTINGYNVYRRVIGSSGAGNANYGELSNTDTFIRLYNSATPLDQSTSAILTGETYAASSNASGRSLSVHGAAAVSDVAVMPSFTAFSLGSQSGSTNFLNGHLAKFKYYPVRVADTQLQLLTQ